MVASMMVDDRFKSHDIVLVFQGGNPNKGWNETQMTWVNPTNTSVSNLMSSFWSSKEGTRMKDGARPN